MSVYRLYDKLNPDMFYIGSTLDMRLRKNGHSRDLKNSEAKLYKYFREESLEEHMEYCIIYSGDDYLEEEKKFIRLWKPPLNTILYSTDLYRLDYNKKKFTDKRTPYIINYRK